MTNEQMDRYEELDVAASELAGGAYVAPYEHAPDYDIRAVLDYCEKHGKRSDELTDEELAPFLRDAAG